MKTVCNSSEVRGPYLVAERLYREKSWSNFQKEQNMYGSSLVALIFLSGHVGLKHLFGGVVRLRLSRLADYRGKNNMRAASGEGET